MINIKFSDNRKVFNWHEGGIPFVSFDMLDKLGVPNMYTTRYRSYDSELGHGERDLRVAYMKGEDVDEARRVIRETMTELSSQLGSDIDHLRITNQQHTAKVIALDAGDFGYELSVEDTREIDGLITDVPDACLVVYGADCPSVYIADPVHGAIGLVHAGWKGTFGRIPQVAIEMMKEKYGSDPADMYAAIGPSICESCYEMGDEIYDRLCNEWSKADADALMKRHESGKYHLDLWKANRMTLERAGVPAERIVATNICTCCNSDEFYSYRARKMQNEQAALMVNRFGK